jgi:hypothetical protein
MEMLGLKVFHCSMIRGAENWREVHKHAPFQTPIFFSLLCFPPCPPCPPWFKVLH